VYLRPTGTTFPAIDAVIVLGFEGRLLLIQSTLQHYHAITGVKAVHTFDQIVQKSIVPEVAMLWVVAPSHVRTYPRQTIKATTVARVAQYCMSLPKLLKKYKELQDEELEEEELDLEPPRQEPIGKDLGELDTAGYDSRVPGHTRQTSTPFSRLSVRENLRLVPCFSWKVVRTILHTMCK